MNTPINPPLNKLKSKSRNGFSLVEVTLSLGLVSFALVTMLGLLPTGLSTLRASMNQTVEAQILQSIASRAVISSFTNVTANTLYFDDEGLPVDSQGAYYTANLAPGDCSFPGSANAAALTNSLKSLKVGLVARPHPTAVGRTNFYTIQIANSGK
jgi:uncharacterized protein (TIGR02598 family)